MSAMQTAISDARQSHMCRALDCTDIGSDVMPIVETEEDNNRDG